jgi:uncharacterized protein YwgA
MTDLPLFFAALRAMGVEPNIDTLADRKKLQKIAYLLQERAQIPLNVTFSWYLHGPYCRDLTVDLYRAFGDPTTWKEGSPGDLVAGDRSKVQELSKFLGEDLKSPDALELLASLEYIRKLARQAGVEETRSVDVLRMKKPFFSYTEVLRCWRKLQQS